MMSVHALLLPELDDLIMRGSPQRQAKILERVTDGLLQRGNQEVLRCLADNRAARFSDDGFCFLVERAKTDGILAENTLLRGDIPPRLFHELLLTATDAVQRRLLASRVPDR